MRRYEIRPTVLRAIFPYTREDGKWRLFDPTEMNRRFPQLMSDYLAPLRNVLRNRENGHFDTDTFYQYSRPQNFEQLSQPKIMNPDICEHPQMCWDANGEFVFSGGAAGGVAIVPGLGVDPLYLVGLLNSTLMDYLIRQFGTPFRGGYLNCEIRFIKDLPIKLPDSDGEASLTNRIAKIAHEAIVTKARLQNDQLSDRERKTLEGEVELHEKRIDEAVFRLYGVDGLPE